MDMASYMAKAMLESFGKVNPKCICFGSSDAKIICGDIKCDQDKAEYLLAIRATCAIESASAALYMFETMAHDDSPSDTTALNVPPTDHPARRKEVFVYVEMAGEVSLLRCFPIIRDAEDKPHLGEWISISKSRIPGYVTPLLPSRTYTNAELDLLKLCVRLAPKTTQVITMKLE